MGCKICGLAALRRTMVGRSNGQTLRTKFLAAVFPEGIDEQRQLPKASAAKTSPPAFRRQTPMRRRFATLGCR